MMYPAPATAALAERGRGHQMWRVVLVAAAMAFGCSLTARLHARAGVSLADSMAVIKVSVVTVSTEARWLLPKPEPEPTIGFYVVSLQGVNGSSPENAGRLNSFVYDWEDACGSNSSIDFTVCPGTVHPKRGYGLTRSFVDCFEKAASDNVSMAYFFEDDARLFNSSFCRPSLRADLYRRLPHDAYALLIGGHHWSVGKTQHLDTWNEGFVHVLMSWGTYGFALPRCRLALVKRHFEDLLASGAETLGPDCSWYEHADQYDLKIYASRQLVVKHPSGYSNTWKNTQPAIEVEWPFPNT